MHQKYGPIVRTRPDTLHANDISFVDKLYTQSPKYRRERWHTILNTLQADGSVLATKDHDMHRRRRAILNPYFSLQNVRRQTPVIQDTLHNLLGRMDNWTKEGIPVDLNKALRAATKDVIHTFAFGEGEKCLEMEDLNLDFFQAFEPIPANHLGTHFRWLARILASIPPNIMTILIPRIGKFTQFAMVSGSP